MTKEEERALSGGEGEAKAKAMGILAAVGKIYGAERLIPVASAQVAGVSYKTIGDAGLEFLEEFAGMGAKASIPSFLNPAGMDRERWREMACPLLSRRSRSAYLRLTRQWGFPRLARARLT